MLRVLLGSCLKLGWGSCRPAKPSPLILPPPDTPTLRDLWNREAPMKQVVTYARYLSCSSMMERTNCCSAGVPVSLLGPLAAKRGGGGVGIKGENKKRHA